MGRCAIKKGYKVCEHGFNSLMDYLTLSNRARPVVTHEDFSSCSGIYHYVGCTLVITRYFPFDNEILLANKLENIELKVVSNTDSLSEAVFKELEEVLLNKKDD